MLPGKSWDVRLLNDPQVDGASEYEVKEVIESSSRPLVTPTSEVSDALLFLLENELASAVSSKDKSGLKEFIFERVVAESFWEVCFAKTKGSLLDVQGSTFNRIYQETANFDKLFKNKAPKIVVHNFFETLKFT